VAAVTVSAPSTRLDLTRAAELFLLLERTASDIAKEL
jgi:DNA-binding IclR family transcriptional regulator